MNPLMQKYITAFNQCKGDDVTKIKLILEKYSDCWNWIAGDSMISDLLDDKTITAEDIVDYLNGVLEYEGGNREFRNAVLAMETCLRREHIVVNIDTDVVDIDDEPAFDYVLAMDDIPQQPNWAH